MADDELTKKLSRRLHLSETAPDDAETENSHPALLREPNLSRKLSSGSSESEKAISGSASDELSKKLSRRQDINEGVASGDKPSLKVFNPYTEFKEFSRKQIKEYENIFKSHDINKDHFIDMEELKRMMEKLGAPQTHLALKHMISEVDEDKDGKLNFREFLLIFRKAAAGELQDQSGLFVLASLTEIDVDKEGVGGAKNFFEAKIESISRGSKFEEEIRAEQEQHRKEAEEKRSRRQQFKEKAAIFTGDRH
ncbi:EF-hand domain-containing protein D2-like [Paramacrobiotus metropolitanus]|uniref:EF-hand domain-containing protein D2-like n=1 Tax=Paramacrobiotus metropolitanus TaxID=2943436 RepID=UPI002445A3D1|nr:EF-hand domain-containing protein D2-like [Paramacrobiotus metropolitanus]